jgi:prevent-host-death family protein
MILQQRPARTGRDGKAGDAHGSTAPARSSRPQPTTLELVSNVDLREAQAQLSSLIARAIEGEEIVLTRAGEPLIRLVALGQRKPSDAFGLDHGLFTVPADFDKPILDFDEHGREAN